MTATEVQQAKAKIKANEILIDIYKNIDCVANEVIKMQLENIELREKIKIQNWI